MQREHVFLRWDVSVIVFWKGNVRQHRGESYFRINLVDEQVHLDLIFLDNV